MLPRPSVNFGDLSGVIGGYEFHRAGEGQSKELLLIDSDSSPFFFSSPLLRSQ